MSKGGIASLNLFYKMDRIHSFVNRRSSFVTGSLFAGYWVLEARMLEGGSLRLEAKNVKLKAKPSILFVLTISTNTTVI
jgi:hypothetical protein